MSDSERKLLQNSEAESDLRLVGRLRECGHFLYYRMGKKSGQRRILVKILAQGSLTQRQLQEMMKLSSGAMSEILAKMEADGLITRAKSAEDRRQVEVTLTPYGRETATGLMEEDGQMAHQLFSCLSAQEKEQFTALLKKLVESWNAMVNEDGSRE